MQPQDLVGFNQTNVPLGPQLTPSCKIPHQIKAKVFLRPGDINLIFFHSRPEERASQKKLVALKIGTLTLAKVRASDQNYTKRGTSRLADWITTWSPNIQIDQNYHKE